MQAFEVFSAMGGVEAVADEARELDVRGGNAILVPVSMLFVSDANVRKTRNLQSIPELASLIEAEGLLNPLCVVAEEGKKGRASGRYGVIAGGRRLMALQFLVENKRVPANWAVPCKEFDSARAVGVSLTENVTQEAMHPADEAEAFRALVNEGKTIAQIAGRFGCSELTVERRLKIANLAPMFLALYRQGDIEPKQLHALALTSDHAKQIEVWESLPSYSRSEYHIKQKLTASEVLLSDDRLAGFVGLKAYQEAGGAIRRDMFGDEDDVYLQDAALLQSLASIRLESFGHEVREAGWKWVEVMQEPIGYEIRARYARVYAQDAKLSDDERQGIDAIEEMLSQLREAHDKITATVDDRDDLSATETAEIVALSEQLESLYDLQRSMREACKVWTKKQLAQAGAIVSVSHHGKLEVLEGLVRPEDKKEAAGAGVRPEGGRNVQEKAKPAFSERLLHSLTAHRTAAVAAALTDNAHVAMVALLHRLILAEGHSHIESPVRINLTDAGHRVGSLAIDYAESQAEATLEAARERWGAKLPADPAALFRYLLAQDAGTLGELLALHVARSFDVIQSREATLRGFNVADAIVDALDLDMADWWTATPAQYLESVPKAKMIEAVTEACGEAEARDLAKMKKGEAVAAAAAKLDGKRWLPAPLRRGASVAQADDQDDTAADDEESTEE
ncbi:ParB/RepB/Spo0J family partition protein [Variovorax sp. LT1P1]|uniref:ParB/RepB/Spo0J family partition protein n=1 Tax=Variovorax sp. LT1P1 TaxID=3443730 RepID=UPI003F47CDFF